MIYFDITNKDKALEFLSQFTRVAKENIIEFINDNIIQTDICTDVTKVNVNNFCKIFNIQSKGFDTENVLLCAIHYTSNFDQCQSIRNFGLRDLQFTLSHNTPLNNFLNEHDIKFDIEKKSMTANGNNYNIEYVDYSSDKPITHIARKIYYDNQLSCFFNIRDITDYLGFVHLRPEILYNIDELLKTDLSHEWHRRCKGYEIKFFGKINEFTEYSFQNERLSNADNMIEMALSVISDCACGEVFAYLKPDTVIPFENIIEIKEL